MGDMSKDFSRYEFQCRCGCGKNTIDAELLKVLQDLRDSTGCRIDIVSGHRCFTHNNNVGGAPNSQHLWGKAADIQVWNHRPSEVYAILDKKYPAQYGIGKYPSWVHVDVRGYRARW